MVSHRSFLFVVRVFSYGTAQLVFLVQPLLVLLEGLLTFVLKPSDHKINGAVWLVQKNIVDHFLEYWKNIIVQILVGLSYLSQLLHYKIK